MRRSSITISSDSKCPSLFWSGLFRSFKAAEYSLTDETYAKLLDQLAKRKFDLTSPDLRDNILNFYSDLSLPLETKKGSARWQSVLASPLTS